MLCVEVNLVLQRRKKWYQETHKGYVGAALWQRKLTIFGASDCKLKAEDSESWTAYSGFLVKHNLLLSTADQSGLNSISSEQIPMWSHIDS